jgi:hypothetical protein
VAPGSGVQPHLGPRKFLAGLVADLIAFAEPEFRLEMKRDDGASLGDHVASAARQLAAMGKAPPKQDDRPECPPELAHLMDWFRDLSGGRGSNGFGPARLTPSDILDGVWLYHRVIPEPWEARAIRLLDGVWMEAAQGAKAAPPPPQPPTKPRRRQG